jgi:hypothetical protein
MQCLPIAMVVGLRLRRVQTATALTLGFSRMGPEECDDAGADKALDMSSARACGHGCSWMLVLNVVSFARFPAPTTSIGTAR